jgi:hypothetical protein
MLPSYFHFLRSLTHLCRPATHPIQLNLQQAKALHRVFTSENYRAWQKGAPSNWQDQFFKSRVPLIIASRYGQNEHLIFSSRAAEQLQERMRWNDLASVSFAVATEIEYVIPIIFSVTVPTYLSLQSV